MTSDPHIVEKDLSRNAAHETRLIKRERKIDHVIMFPGFGDGIWRSSSGQPCQSDIDNISSTLNHINCETASIYYKK